MESISGSARDFKMFAGEKCKETKDPCGFLSIDGGVSCSAPGIESCRRFIEWKKAMDGARAAGKEITVRVTEKGLKYTKSSLYCWMMKKRFEQSIGEFFAMSEDDRQALLNELLAGGISKRE